MKKIFFALILSLAAFLYGCYPGGPEYTSDYNLVLTDFDDEYDFAAQETYFMPDTVNFATNQQNIDDEVVRGYEQLILDEIQSNMTARGYSRVDSTATEAPDMLITVQVIAINASGVSWIPGPGWWGGYYSPGWGWGGWGGWYYPPYYPVGYSFNTGTVLIHLADPDDGTQVNNGVEELPIRWFAGLDGILFSSVEANENRITSGINQAFDQSPYLESNQ